ncbi:MAG TPA: hypothetical protein VGD74_07535 [Vulgatibacter sp.]
MIRRLVLPLLAAASFACSGPASDLPPVQPSADAKPRGGLVISLNRVIQGHFRLIAPMCVGQRYDIRYPAGGVEGAVSAAGGLPIRPGDTAEFRNYMPDVPANVTSLSGPSVLFSPNLVEPYNIVAEGDERFSFWRYTFPLPGVYEFFDTNAGSPGRPVVDSYYGTTTYVGEGTGPKGVVCVDPPGCEASLECLAGKDDPRCCKCAGVCCDRDDQCAAGTTCLRGRCVDPSLLD